MRLGLTHFHKLSQLAATPDLRAVSAMETADFRALSSHFSRELEKCIF